MPKHIIFIKENPFIIQNDVLMPVDTSKVYEVTEKRTDKRSILQNSALHKLFSLIAIELNNGGYSVPYVMNKKQHSLIQEVFNWGKDKMPMATKILTKMEDRLLLKNEEEMEWNMILVKELLWKKLQEALLKKTSTTQLTKGEVDEVYNVLNRLLGEKFGIHVEFPSEESMIFQQNYNN